MGKTELTEKFDRRENLRGTALTIMGGIFWGLADRAVCGSRDYHWNRAVFWMLHGRCPADRRNKSKSFASIEPLTATVISILFMGVAFSWMDLFGFVGIIGAVTILSLPKKKA